MSNEDFYDNDDEMMADETEAGNAQAPEERDDFEVNLNRRAPKGDVFIEVFLRTKHWLHSAVRPISIYREEKDENSSNFFVFDKCMKDPVFNLGDGVRYIKFRCFIELTELEIKMSFSHIEIGYLDENGNLGEFLPVQDGTPETSEVVPVFEKVLQNLADYLVKEKK